MGVPITSLSRPLPLPLTTLNLQPVSFRAVGLPSYTERTGTVRTMEEPKTSCKELFDLLSTSTSIPVSRWIPARYLPGYQPMYLHSEDTSQVEGVEDYFRLHGFVPIPQL